MIFFRIILSIFCILSFITINAQTIKLISNPDASGYSKGYLGSPILYNGNLYIYYLTTNDKRQLAKYDGMKLTLIANPDNGLGVWGTPIVFKNELYFIYKITEANTKLAKFDGSKIVLLENLDADAFNYSPVIFKDKLYFPYYGSDNTSKLGEFDGLSIKETGILTNGTSLFDYPFVFNDTLFSTFFKADTTKISKYYNNKLQVSTTQRTSFSRSLTHFTIFNNNLYCILRDTMNVFKLSKYNGSTFTGITNPDTVGFDKGFLGKPFVFKNALFGLYYDQKGKYRLAKFDGLKITLITNPDAGEFTEFPYYQDKIIFKDAIFSTYKDAQNNYTIAKFDGNTATLIKSPSFDSNKGYIGFPVIYNNILYGLSTSGIRNSSELFQCEGATANYLSKPDAGLGFINNQNNTFGIDRRTSSIVYNGELLTFYIDVNNLFRLCSIKTQPTSLSEEITNIKIYPNPVSDKMVISVTQLQPINVSVFSILGEKIINKKFDNNDIELELSVLPKGLYTVVINFSNSMISKKIIKL